MLHPHICNLFNKDVKFIFKNYNSKTNKNSELIVTLNHNRKLVIHSIVCFAQSSLCCNPLMTSKTSPNITMLFKKLICDQ